MARPDPLAAYHAKRDFAHTPKPAGAAKASARPSRQGLPIFVVQKHQARTLHYDFRLQVGGVLKSWAVPKGPSDNPRDKRLALHTEDHPLAYADFQGVIPPGSYGAGHVTIWDRGVYRPIERDVQEQPVDVEEALAEGHLSVRLQGHKLRGGYTLVRLRGDAMPQEWLLIKMDDAQARRDEPVPAEPVPVRRIRPLKPSHRPHDRAARTRAARPQRQARPSATRRARAAKTTGHARSTSGGTSGGGGGGGGRHRSKP